MTLIELLGFPNGHLRREKAKQYREDARNLFAADILDRIEAELPSFEGSKLHNRVEALSDAYGQDQGSEFSEIVSRVNLDVGFRSSAEDAKGFLEDVIERLQENMRIAA